MGNKKLDSAQSDWSAGGQLAKDVLEINRNVFPAIVLLFGFYLAVERLIPGFFSYTLSEWWFLTPVCLSSILYLFSSPPTEKTTSLFGTRLLLWAVVITIMFGGLFSASGEMSRYQQLLILIGLPILIIPLLTVLILRDQEIRVIFVRLNKTIRATIPFLLPTILTLLLLGISYLVFRVASDPFFRLNS